MTVGRHTAAVAGTAADRDRLWGLFLKRQGLVANRLRACHRSAVAAFAAAAGDAGRLRTLGGFEAVLPLAVQDCGPTVLRSLAAWERDAAAAAARGAVPLKPETYIGWGVRAWASRQTDPRCRGKRLARAAELSMSAAPADQADRFAPPDPAAGPPDRAAAAERAAAVEAALRRLPARTRELVRLVFADGLTKADAARAVGVSRSRVGQLLGRAFDRLRADLAPYGARE